MVLSVHVRLLVTACNSSSRVANTYMSHTCTCTDKSSLKIFKELHHGAREIAECIRAFA